jgi:hypothetical protein
MNDAEQARKRHEVGMARVSARIERLVESIARQRENVGCKCGVREGLHRFGCPRRSVRQSRAADPLFEVVGEFVPADEGGS